MIEINLLPDELKKKQERFKKIDLSKLNLQNIPAFSLIASFFGVLIALQIILFFIGIYSKAISSSMDERYKEILPKKKEAGELKAKTEMMNKKIKAIDELMVKRFSWAKKLNDLNDSLTPGIWLTELSYNERLVDRPISIDAKTLIKAKGQGPLASKPAMEKTTFRYLVISGLASSMGEEGTALIGKFIKAIKDNDNFYSDFSDIELGTIKRDRIEDQEVMSFKITCLFKEVK